MPEFLLTDDLLKQKSEALQFDSMAVVSPESGTMAVYGPHGETLVQMLSEDYQTILESDFTRDREEQPVFAEPQIKDGKQAQLDAWVAAR